MTKHAVHEVHQHSILAFAALDVGARETLILNCYLLAGVPLSDRSVAERLGFEDLNAVRPRVSTLIDRGVLYEAGSVRCPVTGKTVRACSVTSLGRRGGA